ncbi:MAG TPA: sigma-70 family RNA polymerase sigma factor [Magnetospirillaceae bacterium]|jgi:RNA polymerase sigma-70 factor (ECF subfamily)
MSLPLDVGLTMPEMEASSPESVSDAVPLLGTPKEDLREVSDTALMRLIGLGDRAAFSIFCRRHAARCLSIAFHLLRNEADAEEAVQDAFFRVWQNAARWRATEARVTTWLYRVVVNIALDQMRKATRLSVSIEQAAEVIAADPSPESVVGHRELVRVVARAVADLPPRQRAALSLVICEGLDCAEAAQMMGVTVGTMESLLVRGRRHLRGVLADATLEWAKSAKSVPNSRAGTEEITVPLGAFAGLGV